MQDFVSNVLLVSTQVVIKQQIKQMIAYLRAASRWQMAAHTDIKTELVAKSCAGLINPYEVLQLLDGDLLQSQKSLEFLQFGPCWPPPYAFNTVAFGYKFCDVIHGLNLLGRNRAVHKIRKNPSNRLVFKWTHYEQ